MAIAQPHLFKVVPGGPNTSVQFSSNATLETVTGTTHIATGYVELDDSVLRSEIHVDLASLKTGIARRDQDMREDFLQTRQYPEAVFTLTRIELPPTGLVENTRTRVIVRGSLALHGATREIEPEAYLTLEPGSRALRVEAAFSVTLHDYNIARPQFLLLRLAEEQRISVDITAVNESGGETSQKGDK